MTLFPLSIIVSILLLTSSTKKCLDYKRFFQQCGEGEEVKIGNEKTNCVSYFHCKEKEMKMGVCEEEDDGEYILLGKVCVREDLGNRCPFECPRRGFTVEHLISCVEGDTQTVADGDYAGKCKSYFECRDKKIERRECGTDEYGNQKYYKCDGEFPCEGTKKNNVCTIYKL